jgi:hypothetical protein
VRRTRRERQIRYAREQSKKRNESWVVEEVIGGYAKGSIQASEVVTRIRPNGGWWPSSVVKVIAKYENGVRK